MATILEVGVGKTYETINAAVNAASTTEETTIVISAGTYNEDITLDARSMEQKGNIKFVAAEDAEVTITGTVTIGYLEKRVGSKQWTANVEFEGIIFDQAKAETNSIDIQDVVDFALTNCTIVGDGEYGITGTNVENDATITGCTFENAAVQSYGNFGTNLLIDGCTFDESVINIQSGDGVTVSNCTFSNTLTDAANGGSFYVVRSNANPVDIKNCTFNVDSTASETTTPQTDADPAKVEGAKWGSSFAVFCQRANSVVKMNCENVTVNFTDSAMANENLFVSYTSNQYTGTEERIVISDMKSASNDVAALLAKTDKAVAVIDTVNGIYTEYTDGVNSISSIFAERTIIP